MYAVIKTGGKQYRVVEGQFLRVEKIAAEVGSTIELAEVMMVANGDDIKIGTPIVAGSKVEALVREHGRDDKVVTLKFRRRKHHMKRQGHRQDYTELQITSINA